MAKPSGTILTLDVPWDVHLINRNEQIMRFVTHIPSPDPHSDPQGLRGWLIVLVVACVSWQGRHGPVPVA